MYVYVKYTTISSLRALFELLDTLPAVDSGK